MNKISKKGNTGITWFFSIPIVLFILVIFVIFSFSATLKNKTIIENQEQQSFTELQNLRYLEFFLSGKNVDPQLKETPASFFLNGKEDDLGEYYTLFMEKNFDLEKFNCQYLRFDKNGKTFFIGKLDENYISNEIKEVENLVSYGAVRNKNTLGLEGDLGFVNISLDNHLIGIKIEGCYK